MAIDNKEQATVATVQVVMLVVGSAIAHQQSSNISTVAEEAIMRKVEAALRRKLARYEGEVQ